MNATLSPEIANSHADRPTARTQAPFRIVPGQWPEVEWDQDVLLADSKTTRAVRMHLPIEHSAYGNQCGLKISELLELYHAECGRVDGLLAKIDQLATDAQLLAGENERLKSQLLEAKRTNGKKEK